MPRRDYASQKPHSYKAPRLHIYRSKVKLEVLKRRYRRGIIALILIGFLCGIGYILFFSPVFMMYETEAIGSMGEFNPKLEQAMQRVLNRKKWVILSLRNYFLFNKREALDLIAKSDIIPSVYDIEFKQVWPNKLIVVFKSRVPKIQLISANYDYLIDEHGFIADIAGDRVNPVDNLNTENVPMVFVLRDSYLLEDNNILDDKATGAGKRVLQSSVIIQNILKLNSILRSAQFTPSYFEIKDDIFDEVSVYTDKRLKVNFSLSYSLQSQVNNLLLLVQKIGQESISKVNYIDLRIQDRAYICCNLDI